MDNDNHTKLEKYLKGLSQKTLNDEEMEQSVNELKTIYVDDFRHFYSRVFATITTIQNSKDISLQNLISNLKAIFEYVQTRQADDQDFFNHVKKLYDHVNLDVSRIEYTQKLIDDSEEKYKDITTTVQKLNRQSEKMQRDYVTILGIFAAIIIAFVSGMVFSTSVLNNIDKVSVFRLTFVMTVIALFLLNLLNLLINFIKQINGTGTPPSSILSILSPPYTLIGVINLFLIIALILDTAIYFYTKCPVNSQ